MTTMLFDLTFYLAVPFWSLLIAAPGSSVTRRVFRYPVVTLAPLAVYLIVALPHFGDLWTVVSRPDLGALQAFLGTPIGATAIWAQLIAFDLFIGRWMYLDSRERGVPPLLMAPILLLTILLSPIGLLTYLAIRALPKFRPRGGTPTTAPDRPQRTASSPRAGRR